MLRKISLVVYAGLLFVLAACGTPPPDLDRSPYGAENELSEISMTVKEAVVEAQADTVTLVIKNLSGKLFDFGAPYELETQIDDVWYTYPPKEEMAFIMILYTLEPYGMAEEPISLYNFFGTLEPGTYRVVKSFSSEEGTEGVAFAVFQV